MEQNLKMGLTSFNLWKYVIPTQCFTFLNLNMGTVYIQSLIYDLLGLVVLIWLSGKSSNDLIFNQDYSYLLLHSIPVQPKVIKATFKKIICDSRNTPNSNTRF